jgi:hypothetical protein
MEVNWRLEAVALGASSLVFRKCQDFDLAYGINIF